MSNVGNGNIGAGIRVRVRTENILGETSRREHVLYAVNQELDRLRLRRVTPSEVFIDRFVRDDGFVYKLTFTTQRLPAVWESVLQNGYITPDTITTNTAGGISAGGISFHNNQGDS